VNKPCGHESKQHEQLNILDKTSKNNAQYTIKQQSIKYVIK